MQESWENLIDEAAAEEAQYSERFGGRTSGTSLTDYLDRWNTGGRSTYGGGYGGWRSTINVDKGKQDREKSKRTIAKNLNVLNNSTNGEKSLKLGFATSQETVNDAHSDTVYMPSDIFDKTESHGEATDILSGMAMIAATMKRTIHPRALAQSRKSNDTQAKYIWEAMEQAFARKDVLDNWSGFSGFFDAHRDYSTGVDNEYMDEVVGGDIDVRAATIAAVYNILNPHDARLMDDDRMKQVMSYIAGKMIKGTKTTRFAEAEEAADLIRKLFKVEEEEKEESKSQGESDDESDESGEGEGEGEGGDGGDDESQDGASGGDDKGDDKSADHDSWLDALNQMLGDSGDPLPDQVDKSLFGTPMDATEDDEPDDVSELVLPSIPHVGEPPHSVKFIAYQNQSLDTPSKKARATVRKNRYRDIVAQNKPAIDAIVNSLDLMNNDPRSYVHGQRSGSLDPASLYKLTFGQDNPAVFEKQQVISGKKIAVTLLVDRSGSMGYARDGEARMDKANKVCIVMAEALDRVRGVSLNVYTHESSYRDSYMQDGEKIVRCTYPKKATENDCDVRINEIITPEKDERLMLPSVDDRGANFDGYAIEAVSKRLIEDYPEHDNRIVFVISDGQPCSRDYEGEAAMDHVSDASSFCRAFYKVDVYGIGIDNAFSDEEGTKMYGEGNSIVLGDVASSIGVMTSFLRKVATKNG